MDAKTVLALSDYLSQFITFHDDPPRSEGCDGTLSKTIKWLKAHRRRNVSADVAWLQARGGYCDCEVLLNVVTTLPEDAGIE